MLIPVVQVVIVALFWPTSIASKGVEIELERLEQIDGNHLLESSGVRVRKYNRTVSVLDGTFSILKDLDDSFEFGITVARSAMGNNQFNEYPMKIPRKKACRMFREEYAEYQHVWAGYTNLPQVVEGQEPFCPLPKGDYWVKNFAPEASWIPPVVPEGYWRITLGIYGSTGELEGQVRGFLRLKKNLM